MGDSWQQYGRRVVSGEERGIRAGVMRLGLSAIAPIYAAAVRARNFEYNRGIGRKSLPRPVVSVGNITTGGTGKTPVVRWLCDRLRHAGERPAVLLRGYKAAAGARGDEQAMLESLLNHDAALRVIVHANSDRYAGGCDVLRDHPDTSVFVMDDGFQHRRLNRDFDLVLIDASNPFGYGRVLPRGLLREPLAGLKRADAVLITHCDQGKDVEAISQRVGRFNSRAPILRSSHVHAGFLDDNDVHHPPEALAARRPFAVAAIGNPAAFAGQFRNLAGYRWFDDHWDYCKADVEAVISDARLAGADCIVTTEKDWPKLARWLDRPPTLPFYRAELALRFAENDENLLLEIIRQRLQSVRA